MRFYTLKDKKIIKGISTDAGYIQIGNKKITMNGKKIKEGIFDTENNLLKKQTAANDFNIVLYIKESEMQRFKKENFLVYEYVNNKYTGLYKLANAEYLIVNDIIVANFWGKPEIVIDLSKYKSNKQKKGVKNDKKE